jgi:hypothetical protein
MKLSCRKPPAPNLSSHEPGCDSVLPTILYPILHDITKKSHAVYVKTGFSFSHGAGIKPLPGKHLLYL